MHDIKLNGKGHTPSMSPVNTEFRLGAAAEDSWENIPVINLLQVVWRRFWIVALVAVALAGAAVGLSLQQTPTYQASIKVLVEQELLVEQEQRLEELDELVQQLSEQSSRQEGQESDTLISLSSDVQRLQQSLLQSANLSGDVNGLQQFTQTAAELVHTPAVAEAATRELNLEMAPEGLLGNMTAEKVEDTQIIEVTYRDSDRERTQRVANTVGKVFSEQIPNMSPSSTAITATVVEEASIPEAPLSPNPMRSGLVALVTGLLLGVGLASLLEHLDDISRSPEEVEQVSGVPNFGVIRAFWVPKHSRFLRIVRSFEVPKRSRLKKGEG